MPPTPATLTPTALIDADHPAIVAFAAEHAVGADDRARSVSLFTAVRDRVRYDPYRIDLSPAGMRASRALRSGHGWCVTKAALLAAVARAARLPARVGYADVRNHLSTERLRRTMGTDLFVWHGYAEVWIDGAWRKAVPAFNVELCERFGLQPLEFDGHHDALFHPFDRAGRQHMEYVRQRGSFDDVPLARIVETFRATYPSLPTAPPATADADGARFEADAAHEAVR
jgi:transglutaminase-like putative cysteine protease